MYVVVSAQETMTVSVRDMLHAMTSLVHSSI